LPQEISLTFIQRYPYLNLNISQIKCHLKHLECISQENNDHEIHVFNKKEKILENTMNFLPNVSFNSPFVPPIIQHVGLE
jgi:hypothetical protein